MTDCKVRRAAAWAIGAWLPAALFAQESPPAPTAAPAQASAATPASVRPRSVVFYVIDTCRADRLSAYGCERETSKELEKLAKLGVKFERCFSQAPWTKPSVASMLTSCYPTVTGMHRFFDQLDERFVTLPEALRAAGWRTAGFSTNPVMGRMSNYQQGFDEFMEATQIIPGGDSIGHSTGSGAAINEKVLPFLAANERAPWFLWLHSIDPHEMYDPEPADYRKFTTEAKKKEYERQLREIRQKNPGKVGSVTTQEHFERAKVKVEPFIETALALYDADIRANDREIGELHDALRKRPEFEDAIFVVTSDHGEEFMENGGTSHAYTVYNELLHVPLIIVAPGLVPAGLVVKEPVQSIDLYPTLLELLGVPSPDGLQGRSFASLLAGEAGDAHAVFAELHEMPDERFFPGQGNLLSVIEGPWKYILNLKPTANRQRPRHELYRLDIDFREEKNLAEAEPERVARLEEKVLEWWAKNQARHAGVDVKSLTEKDLSAADPETLRRLRELGYLE